MASQEPVRFSVGIPLYNKRDYIRRTLEAVLRQTLAPLEVVIVDDGSTDGGAEVIADLVGGPVRIVRQVNGGEGAARNRIFAEARGDWIALIDADDLWREDHLANLAAIVARIPQARVVASASRHETSASLATLVAEPPRPASIRIGDFFDEDGRIVHSSSVAIHRDAYDATTGFGDFGFGTDTEFWIRLALDNIVGVSDRATSIYMLETGGIMDIEQARVDAGGTPRDGSPIFPTLAAALADPRYAARHAAIRGFDSRTRILYARSLIYHGYGAGARRMLAPVRGRQASAYRALSRVPGTFLRRASRFYSTIKRRLRPA